MVTLRKARCGGNYIGRIERSEQMIEGQIVR